MERGPAKVVVVRRKRRRASMQNVGRNFGRRGLFGGLAMIAGIGVLATPLVTPAFADEIIITREPPPLRTEVIPVIPRERAELEVWQPGHWRWDGREHVWVEGRYVARPH